MNFGSNNFRWKQKTNRQGERFIVEVIFSIPQHSEFARCNSSHLRIYTSTNTLSNVYTLYKNSIFKTSIYNY